MGKDALFWHDLAIGIELTAALVTAQEMQKIRPAAIIAQMKQTISVPCRFLWSYWQLIVDVGERIRFFLSMWPLVGFLILMNVCAVITRLSGLLKSMKLGYGHSEGAKG